MHRAFGIASRRGTDAAKAEMDINYFGLLRLAQEFGPALKGALGRRRDACRRVGQPALGLRALELPAARHLLGVEGGGLFARAMPARRDAAVGIRVVNVFPGPIDDEWNQNLPPPKVAPGALASAIVKALKEGIEDVYPGDVAQEWVERWRENPKVLERELAAGG